MATPLEPLHDATEDAREELVVAGAPVDLFATNSSSPDVVDAAGDLESWDAGHAPSLGGGFRRDASW
jgi:hypothetical protein